MSEQDRFNKMWDLWVEGKVKSPYKELMTYQSEVNNGGHDQYFLNVSITGELVKEIEELNTVLPEILKSNLNKALEAYKLLEKETEDGQVEEILEQCDDIFFENEAEVNQILEEYAAVMEIVE